MQTTAFSTHAAFMENPKQQKRRSKSLTPAWVIYQQADMMVYYLVKQTPPNRRTETVAGTSHLFSNHLTISIMEMTARLTRDAKISTQKINRQVVNFSVAINDSYRVSGK